MTTEPSDTTTTRWARGLGLVTRTFAGQVLDAWFPNPGSWAATMTTGTLPRPAAGPGGCRRPHARRVTAPASASTSTPPPNTVDAYLRLHLLSHRLVQPNSISLDGIFAVLPNVVWTNYGPCGRGVSSDPGAAAGLGPVTVYGVDKFPGWSTMSFHRGPDLDADRVRLGAHLATGTTVMHEGFVNFNAGTLGASMVEGRISQGVVVGDGSDIEGGGVDDGHPSPAEARSGCRSATLSARRSLAWASRSATTVSSRRPHVTAGTKATPPGRDRGEGA